MLILTRKVEQGIVIDGHTTIRVLSIDGERVKIGIDAPPRVTVLREELVAEVSAQNREAGRRRTPPEAVHRLRDLPRPPAGSGSAPPADSAAAPPADGAAALTPPASAGGGAPPRATDGAAADPPPADPPPTDPPSATAARRAHDR